MPRLVLIAKNSYVWLDQLSQEIQPRHHPPGPDPRRGTGPAGPLGLHRPVADRPVGAQPGLRRASSSCAATPTPWPRPIRLCAIQIADDLGGEEAYRSLRDRAWQRGIRLASDMVPNHMGIDSPWVVEHPGLVRLAGLQPLPVLHLQRPRPVQRWAGRHFHRRPLLRPHRCRRGLQAR